jgi:hypothetical protein
MTIHNKASDLSADHRLRFRRVYNRHPGLSLCVNSDDEIIPVCFSDFNPFDDASIFSCFDLTVDANCPIEEQDDHQQRNKNQKSAGLSAASAAKSVLACDGSQDRQWARDSETLIVRSLTNARFEI